MSPRPLVFALLALAACSEQDTPPAASAAGETLPPTADESADEVEAVLPGEPMEPERFAEKYALASPEEDDWDTEQLSGQAQATLKSAVLPFLLHGVEGPAVRAALVTPEFTCTDLRPDVLEEVHREAGLVVREGEVHGRPFAGAEGLADALMDLGAPLEGAEARSFGIKTTRVSAQDHPLEGLRVETEVHIRLFGRLPSGSIQIDATWICNWVPGGPQGLELKEVELAHYTEVQLEAGRWFSDVTEAVLGSNPSFGRQLGHSLDTWAGTIDGILGMSTIGHEGLAVGDADGDGLDDLYVCQPGGLPNLLFVRRPDGTAEDVSRRAGVDWLDPSRSALFVDLDGDGDQDLVVEADPVLLLMENDGSGRFALKATADAPSTTSLSAADHDLDGDLDLFACGYMLPDESERIPIPYHDANNGRPNTLLRNDIEGVEGGDWVFTDVTREVGLDRNNRRYSFAAGWEDYDEDGDPDLYVANDFGRNNLYRNDGGRFVDVAAEAGVEDMAAGMGVAWSDLDRDGRMDLYVGNMFSSAGGRITYQRRFQRAADDEVRRSYQRHARGNTLFRNLGDGHFADVTESAGVAMGRWAWGAIAVDLQNDGRPDLVVPNGFVTGEDPDDL